MPGSIGHLFLLIGFGLAGLLMVRAVCAVFNDESEELIQEHPYRHFVLALVAFALVQAPSAEKWTSVKLSRHQQRKLVRDRIQAAGGWEALRQACEELARTNQGQVFHYSGYGNRGFTALPKSIAALQPQDVMYYDPVLQRAKREETPIPVVCIKVFGAYSTQSRSRPYLELRVACGPLPDNFRPPPGWGGSFYHRRWSYRPLSERIFEIYLP
jgi:hypothetical protein